MIVHAISDISKREKNQDNYWYARFNVTNGTSSEEALVACVCDGMGGLEDGEKASRVVIEKVRKFFMDGRPLSSISDILKEAHEDIRGFSDKRSGTTCVILVCLGGKYRVVNIGDSRCYRSSGVGTTEVVVTQITNDHTAINKFREEGKEITDEMRKKYKNMLSRCVGASKTIKLDEFDGKYQKGDVFLLCSDGFWHTLSSDDFKSGAILDLEKMVEKCKKLGETDNITACLVQV